jgi:sulfonate transport system substrate-binding protein
VALRKKLPGGLCVRRRHFDNHGLLADRRAVLLGGGAAAIGGLVALTACAPRAAKTPAAEALRVAIVGKGEADNQLLLKAAGVKTDFPVAYSHFESGHLVIQAMDAHALDYGGMSEIPPIFALGAGTPSFRQIAVAHGDVNNQVVLVPKGSPIHDLGGLKGKRVGYVRATTSQYFLLRMLQSVGLDWGDITPVAMSVADAEAAFSTGALDAWAIYGFPIERALATEGARILKTALGFLSGNYLVSASVDALADPEKSKEIGRFLIATRAGYAWAAAHQAQWAQEVAKQIGVPLPYVQDEFRRKSASYTLLPVTEAAIVSQQNVADAFAQQKLIPAAVNVRPLWDDRFNSLIEEKA